MTNFPVSEGKISNLLHRMLVLGLREEDFEETYYRPASKRSSSKALTGVALLHKATGIRVRCNRETSQGINRFVARRTLVEELEARLTNKTRHEVKAEKIRQDKQRRRGSRKRTQQLGAFARPDVEMVHGKTGEREPGTGGSQPTPSKAAAPGTRKGFDLAEAQRGFILRMPSTGLPGY